MRVGVLIIAAAASVVACARPPVEAAPCPAPPRAVQTNPAARAEADRRAARLELALMGKEAQLEDLQLRLDAARQEVVRAMAKLQTFASRAEAASGMAEAELALQSLRATTGEPVAPEAAQARRLLVESSAEFGKENYGGALYLANQAKVLATAGRGRLTSEPVAERPGETPFELPVLLKAVSAGNVRQGPGLTAPVTFAVRPGDSLTGFSYVDEWVRISDEQGRSGWIYRSLIGRR